MRHGLFLLLLAAVIFNLITDLDVYGGDAVKAVNLDKLNTAADEEDPAPTADGNSLLYVTKVKGNYRAYISARTVSTMPFPAGKLYKPLGANKVADDRSPFVFKDKTYFATNEVRDEIFAKLKNFDLMAQIGFQAPMFVAGNVNTKADEMYPWITPAGKEFYFSRKTADGWMLYVANGPIPGPIGKAKEVGFPAGYHRATVAGNGLTMYLQGPLGSGRLGIFRSKRDKAGAKWSEPEELTALNHAESKKGDMQPALSWDATRLYFVSDRPGGRGGMDIWMVGTAQLK